MGNAEISPPSSESPSLVASRPFWLWFFREDHTLRSGWRFAIYVSGFAVLWSASALFTRILRPHIGLSSLWILQISEFVSFAVAFGIAWMMAAFEGRSVGIYGLPLRGAFGRLFWIGCAVGVGEISVLMALIAAFGGYSFGAIALHGGALVSAAASWAIFFLVAGLLEEFLFRGYTQHTLAEGIGFWPAAFALSATFALVHLYNPGEGWVGAAGVFTIGLVFCFALKRTGNLWFCVGMHAAFDFGETFLYSVPNSGVLFEGHLSSASLHGPAWLTGGSAGPEGTVLSFLTMGAVALFIHVLFPAKPTLSVETAAARAVQ
jgi:membrane protease YdiL (CAAX protease family)